MKAKVVENEADGFLRLYYVGLITYQQNVVSVALCVKQRVNSVSSQPQHRLAEAVVPASRGPRRGLGRDGAQGGRPTAAAAGSEGSGLPQR